MSEKRILVIEMTTPDVNDLEWISSGEIAATLKSVIEEFGPTYYVSEIYQKGGKRNGLYWSGRYDQQ